LNTKKMSREEKCPQIARIFADELKLKSAASAQSAEKILEQRTLDKNLTQ
jgi:hypothetical protein